MRSVGRHGQFGSVTQDDRSLLAFPVFEMLAIQVLVWVTPVLQNVFAGGVFHADIVLVDRDLVTTGRCVSDGFAFAVLLELTASLARTAATATTGWALVTEVEIHIDIVAVAAPVRLRGAIALIVGLVISAHLRPAEMMSVGRWVGGTVLMVGMVMVAVAALVVIAHTLTQQAAQREPQEAHKRVAAAQNRADKPARKGTGESSVARPQNLIATTVKLVAPTAAGDMGVETKSPTNNRKTHCVHLSSTNFFAAFIPPDWNW